MRTGTSKASATGAAIMVVLLLVAAAASGGTSPTPASEPRALCTTRAGVHYAADGIATWTAGAVGAGPIVPDHVAYDPTCTPRRIYTGSPSGVRALTPEGRLLWHRPDLGEVYSPVVAGGVLFVAGLDGRVTRLDAQTGRSHWVRQLDGWLLRPAVAGARVIVGGASASAIGLDTADGRTRWELSLDQQLAHPPVAQGGTVVLATYGPTLLGVAARTGALRWRHALAAAPSLLASAGELLLAGTYGDELLAVDADSGAALWRSNLTGRPDAPPSSRGGILLQPIRLSRDRGALQALDTASGEPRCRIPLPAPAAGRPLEHGELLLVPVRDGVRTRSIHSLVIDATSCTAMALPRPDGVRPARPHAPTRTGGSP